MKIDLIKDGAGLLKGIIIPEKDISIISATFRQMDDLYFISLFLMCILHT